MSPNLRARDSVLGRLSTPSWPAPRRTGSGWGVPVPRDAVPRMIRTGQHLFWCGDAIAELWAIQHGTIKTYEVSSGGAERVSGFFFAGDVLGWEALACGSFRSNAVALERTVVIALPVTALLDAALGRPQHQAQLLDGIRSDFLRLHARLRLEQCAADQRLAGFLLWVAHCQGAMAEGAMVRLPMAQNDIANYLGLAAETVSRRLARFQRNGWIRLQRRCLWLQALAPLQQLSETE